MVNRVVSVDFTTTGASRVTHALSDIEKASVKTAANTTKAAGNIQKSFEQLGSTQAKLFNPLKTGLSGIGAGLDKAGLGQSKFAGQLLTTVGAVTTGLIAFRALRGTVTHVADAYRDQERANRLTNAVLLSTGGAAGVAADHVADLAGSLSRTSGVADEVIQSGENVLLTFVKIRNVGKDKIFDGATKSALDMSTALSQSLQTSVIQIGKSLNDPVKSITALRRAGVSFTDSQVKLIKSLAESGRLLEAQKIILRELQTEFGGAAAAAADPFAKLNASVKELEESLGKTLIPQTLTYVNLLAKGVDLATKIGSGGGSTPSGGVSLKGLPAGDDPLAQMRATYKAFFLHGPVGVLDLKKNVDTANVALKRLTNATKEYDAAVKSGVPSRVREATLALANAYFVLHPELRKAKSGLKDNKDGADETSLAYLGLADDIKTAAAALDAIHTKAFAGIRAKIDVDTARTNVQDAVKEVTNPDTGSSGGGGGGATQTAVASALERSDKEAALRDAIQGVGDADRDATSAQTALLAARKNYDTVLQGVAKNTKAAREAEQAYTQAQDNAKSSVLDLRDARRQLTDALDAQANAARDANQALGSANRGLASAKLDLADAKLNLQDAREGEDPEEIARAQIALGDAYQRVRDATEGVTKARKDKADVGKKNSKVDDDVKRAQIGVTEASIKNKQATQDLNEAHRILEGTLHGFAATSQEAKDALDTYRGAIVTAREAQDTAKDSARQLERAQADLSGALDSVGGSAQAAGKKVESLTTRVNNAKTAIIDLAEKDRELARLRAVGAGKDMQSAIAAGVLAEIDAIKGAVQGVPELEHAFDAVIAQLEDQYRTIAFEKTAASLKKEAGTQGAVTGRGSFFHAASGGAVPGHDPTGIPVLAHPGEYVMSRKGVEKYGLHAMELLNKGTLPKFSAGGPVGAPASLRPLGTTTIVQEIHFHNHGILAGRDVGAWLEEEMANARRHGHNLERNR